MRGRKRGGLEGVEVSGRRSGLTYWESHRATLRAYPDMNVDIILTRHQKSDDRSSRRSLLGIADPKRVTRHTRHTRDERKAKKKGCPRATCVWQLRRSIDYTHLPEDRSMNTSTPIRISPSPSHHSKYSPFQRALRLSNLPSDVRPDHLTHILSHPACHSEMMGRPRDPGVHL